MFAYSTVMYLASFYLSSWLPEFSVKLACTTSFYWKRFCLWPNVCQGTFCSISPDHQELQCQETSLSLEMSTWAMGNSNSRGLQQQKQHQGQVIVPTPSARGLPSCTLLCNFPKSGKASVWLPTPGWDTELVFPLAKPASAQTTSG